MSITFYPGATLESSLYAKTKAQQAGKEFKDPSIRASLQAAGFKDVDISAAFAAQYQVRYLRETEHGGFRRVYLW